MLERNADISPAEHKEHMYEYLHTHTNADEAAVSSRESHHRWVNIISEKIKCYVVSCVYTRKNKELGEKQQRRRTIDCKKQKHDVTHLPLTSIACCFSFALFFRCSSCGENFSVEKISWSEKINEKEKIFKWFIFENIYFKIFSPSTRPNDSKKCRKN